VGSDAREDGDKGLEIEPEDEVEVVKYLSKNFGVDSGSKTAGH